MVVFTRRQFLSAAILFFLFLLWQGMWNHVRLTSVTPTSTNACRLHSLFFTYTYGGTAATDPQRHLALHV